MSSIISYRLEGKLIIRLTLCRSQSHQPAHPIACHNQPELEELRKQLKELLDAGLLQPAKSPYGAPLLFQKKQDDSLRMCVDYRALNKVTIRNNYPIPLVADCFDQLSKCLLSWISDRGTGKSGLQRGMNQRRLVSRGMEEFVVMLFGLTNAAATFCTLMNQVVRDYLENFVVVYLDLSFTALVWKSIQCI